MQQRFTGGQSDKKDAWVAFLMNDGNMDKCEMMLKRRVEIVKRISGPQILAEASQIGFLRFACQIHVSRFVFQTCFLRFSFSDLPFRFVFSNSFLRCVISDSFSQICFLRFEFSVDAPQLSFLRLVFSDLFSQMGFLRLVSQIGFCFRFVSQIRCLLCFFSDVFYLFVSQFVSLRCFLQLLSQICRSGALPQGRKVANGSVRHR